jgi:hypothetical protein
MLQRLFQHSLQTLHHQCHNRDYIPQPVPDILTETVVLVEKILHWEFDETSDHTALPGTSAPGSQSDDDDLDSDQPDIRRSFTVFPGSWRSIVGNQDVIWLFFSVRMMCYVVSVSRKIQFLTFCSVQTYLLLQNDDRLAHRLRQCLIQLSGQNEKFFDHNHEAVVEYVNAIVHGLLKCLNK